MAELEHVWPGDMLPSHDARERLHAFLDGLWSGGKRRSFRDAAAETQVSFNTLSRLSRGRSSSSDTLDAICRTWPHSSNLRNRRDPKGHLPRRWQMVAVESTDALGGSRHGVES